MGIGDLSLTCLKREKAKGEHGATIFQNAWSIYDTLSEKNYMHHREIYARVGEWLEKRSGEPYSILDLGCGNARFLAPCLQKHPPGMYIGVDLSGAALEEAKGHLAGLLHVALRQEEMVKTLERSSEEFEVIFSGYAMHHLDSPTKEKFLTLCFERLAKGGGMLLVDITRKEGETRDEYIRKYLEFMRRDWTEVPREELEEACAHVQVCDFPETESVLTDMAKRAGFGRLERLAAFGPHQLFGLGKAE